MNSTANALSSAHQMQSGFGISFFIFNIGRHSRHFFPIDVPTCSGLPNCQVFVVFETAKLKSTCPLSFWSSIHPSACAKITGLTFAAVQIF